MKVAKKSAINDVVILKTKQKVHFLKKNNTQRLLERTLGSEHTNDIITLPTAEFIKWQKCARMGLNGFHIR